LVSPGAVEVFVNNAGEHTSIYQARWHILSAGSKTNHSEKGKRA